MKKIYVTFLIIAGLALTACGDKNKPAAKPQSANKKEDSVPALPSIASQVGSYQLIDFGKKIQFKQFLEYRSIFVRAAASDESYDAKKFAELAIMEVGSEKDAFKRDDLAKQNAANIADIKKNAIKRLLLTDSTERGETMGGSVSPYDMEKESYTIGFNLNSFHISYDWQDKDHNYGYSFLLDTPSIAYIPMATGFIVEVKVPKDKAREIEAKLSSIRGRGDSNVDIPADFYVSPGKIDESSRWEQASLHVNLEAISLRLKDQPVGTPLIFIDGPQLKRKQ